jgi:hypothetical protein
MPLYAQAGVHHLWFVDPLARTLEAFALEAGAWRVLGAWRGEARVRVDPLDAMELELAALWQK